MVTSVDCGERGGAGKAEDYPHIGNRHSGWDMLVVVGSWVKFRRLYAYGGYYGINVTTREK